MAKPTTYTEIAFTTTPADTAPAWEDVTPFVMNAAGGINITKWRPDEFAQCQPSTCRFTLDNTDGDFTPGLATGAHYPYVKKGRRVRVVSTTFANTAFETNTAGWSGSNATIAQVATPVRSGEGAMRLTAVAAGNMTADTPGGVSGEPVVGGAAYALIGWFRTAVTARSCFMRSDWYTAAGAYISSTDTGTIVDSTSAYTTAEARVIAPATAAFVRMRAIVLSAAIGEVHYVDFALVGSVRFSGYIDDWQVAWPGVVVSFATCAVTASSRMARLGGAGELESIVEEEIRLDSPLAYYTLGEPADSIQANDSSGNQAPALTEAGTGTGVVFGDATGPSTDGLTAATFAAGKRLATTTPVFVASTEAVVEVFFSTTTSQDADMVDIRNLQSGGAPQIAVGMVLGRTVYAAVETDGGIFDFAQSSTTYHDGDVHHAAAVFSAGAGVQLFVDGVLVDTSAEDFAGETLTASTVSVGASHLDTRQFSGSLSHVAAFTPAPSAGRIAAHADAGLTGFAGETPAARLDRYAVFAGVPAAETDFDTGDVTDLAHIDTAGKTALACMRDVETTEGGVLFDAGDGTLKFHDRSHRYNAASAFTVALSSSVVTTPFAPVLDDQQMVNDMTGTGSTGITGRYKDDDSINEYGSYRRSVDLATSDPDEPLLAAGWRVNRYADPVVRMGPVDVHLNKATAAITASVLAAEVATKFTLTGLPANAPESSMVLFVEGEREHIDASEHKVTLLTSAADVFDVWILDSSTNSQLDETTRVAY